MFTYKVLPTSQSVFRAQSPSHSRHHQDGQRDPHVKGGFQQQAVEKYLTLLKEFWSAVPALLGPETPNAPRCDTLKAKRQNVLLLQPHKGQHNQNNTDIAELFFPL